MARLATKQHRLPASFIGGFGQGKGPGRSRKVWVRRRGGQPQLATAESLNYELGAFETALNGEQTVDDVWDLYERELVQAIDNLSARRPVPIQHSLQTLVPFVACLCVRDGSFDDFLRQKYLSDGDTGTLSEPDWIDLHRVALVPPIASRLLRCNWIVCETSPGLRFITNDRGFTGGADPEGKLFMFVPLRPDAGLQLRRRAPALWRELPYGRVAIFGRRPQLTREETELVNNRIAALAAREIYGREEGDVAGALLDDTGYAASFFAGHWLEDVSDDRHRNMDRYWLDELDRAAARRPSEVIFTRLAGVPD